MFIIKKLITVTAAILLLVAVPVYAKAATDVSAKSAIVYEPETGTVLFEKNADDRMLIASTTKIMTALIALEHCSLDDTVTIPAECENVEGSSMYLKAGDIFSMRELLYGLMLESGNDAAVAIACHVAGNVEDFAKLMNDRAEELGCRNTHFVNPNGLDAAEHYSSARDLAVIAGEALKNEIFLQIVSTKSITINGRTYTNHNKLLWSCDGVIGVKTGYTKSAGRTLVTCCERDGMRLICVTLSDPDDWLDHSKLYDETFAAWRIVRTPEAGVSIGKVSVISGVSDSVSVAPAESTSILAAKDAKISTQIELPEFAYARINKGNTAGRLIVKIDGEEAFSTELIYEDTVEIDLEQHLSFWEKIKRSLRNAV